MEMRITMTTHQRDAHKQPHKRERQGARWRAGAQCWCASRKPLRYVYDYGCVKQTYVWDKSMAVKRALARWGAILQYIINYMHVQSKL